MSSASVQRVRAHNEKDSQLGELARGWDTFYASSESYVPRLRTYGAGAEKFSEAFRKPLQSERPHKVVLAAPTDAHTWGIGGSLKQGPRCFPEREVSNTDEWSLPCKRRIDSPTKGEVYGKQHQWGRFGPRLGRVMTAAGEDIRTVRSGHYTLENQLQRRARVPEETRSDFRTIHRMAPPGLKGFMGAEYSNDYFKHGAPSVPAVLMRPSKEDREEMELRAAAARSRRAGGKTFRQKRAEEELASQVELVSTLALEFDYLEDDEDRPEQEPAPAPEPA